MRSHNIYIEDLVQTCVGPVHTASASLSSYELCSCELKGHCFLDVLHPISFLYFFLFPPQKGFLSSVNWDLMEKYIRAECFKVSHLVHIFWP